MPGFPFRILPYQSMDGGANNSIWLDFCNTSSSNRPRASACTLEIAKKLSSALASLFGASPPPHSNYRDNRFTYDIIAVRARASWRGRGVITTSTFLSLVLLMPPPAAPTYYHRGNSVLEALLASSTRWIAGYDLRVPQTPPLLTTDMISLRSCGG